MSFTFHPPLPDPSEDFDRMWQEIKGVKYDHPEVHVACNAWWYLSVKLSAEKLSDGQVPVMFGYPVFLTNDVHDPRGYEVRPGRSPGEGQ